MTLRKEYEMTIWFISKCDWISQNQKNKNNIFKH